MKFVIAEQDYFNTRAPNNSKKHNHLSIKVSSMMIIHHLHFAKSKVIAELSDLQHQHDTTDIEMHTLVKM